MNAPTSARNLVQDQPVSLVAPIIEARFQLELAQDEDNPLQAGGRLCTSDADESVLAPGVTCFTSSFVAFPACPSTLSLVLESDGRRVIELELEVTELGSDGDPVEVCATSRGVSADDAACLVLATGTYAWRLTGHLVRTVDRLQLTFGLAQELGPVNLGGPIDALTSVRLPFDAAEGDEPQLTRIKIRPSGVGTEVPT